MPASLIRGQNHEPLGTVPNRPAAAAVDDSTLARYRARMSDGRLSIFCKGDLDGFFGLFVDNLVQLLLIVQLCGLCGIAAADPLLLHYILPGAAASILLGNVFYAWQAHRLAAREGRHDVTALPYGINTPSLLVYIFFVMMPVYQRTGDARAAWQMGLVACLGSGLIELAGSLVAERIRRHTPRAALLSTLAGIAIGFISMTFALQIFQRPLVAMLPLAVVLVTYFARFSFPWGLPGGFVAVALGTLCAWALPAILPTQLAGPAMSVTAATEALVSSGVVRAAIRWPGGLGGVGPARTMAWLPFGDCADGAVQCDWQPSERRVRRSGG